MSENMTYVPSRLTSAKTDKVVAGANEILDDDINLKQDVINTLSKKVIDLNSVPTSSTLTYIVNSVTCNFKVGDEVRVADQQSETGYTFYKLYELTTESSVTTATWDKLGAGGGGSAAGLEIVAASGTTLNAEVGKYYRYDSYVSTLAVTLPTITGATEVHEFVLNFSTSGSASVTFTGGNIKQIGNFTIKGDSLYEISLKWNGNEWILVSDYNVPYDAKISYLESNGNQYINTGFVNTLNTEFNLDFQITDDATQDRKVIGTSNRFGFALDGGHWRTIGSEWYVTSKQADNNRHYLTTNSGKFIMDSVQIADRTGYTVAATVPMFIFAASLSSTTIDRGPVKMKLYSCNIYDNGNLIREFIPVRVGTIGYLYDRVSKTLFGNSGSGSFTLGPDV